MGLVSPRTSYAKSIENIPNEWPSKHSDMAMQSLDGNEQSPK